MDLKVKNGQLKNLIHGKHDIFHQIVFNFDVTLALQQVHQHLKQKESMQTLQCLCVFNLSKTAGVKLANNLYVMGKCKQILPSAEQARVLRCTGKIEIFPKLYKEGVLYYSQNTNKPSTRKRDNTYCCYLDTDDETVYFARIVLFVKVPGPFALVQRLCPLNPSLLGRAGHPCMSVLIEYQKADLLELFMFPMDLPTVNAPLVCINIAQDRKK